MDDSSDYPGLWRSFEAQVQHHQQYGGECYSQAAEIESAAVFLPQFGTQLSESQPSLWQDESNVLSRSSSPVSSENDQVSIKWNPPPPPTHTHTQTPGH